MFAFKKNNKNFFASLSIADIISYMNALTDVDVCMYFIQEENKQHMDSMLHTSCVNEVNRIGSSLWGPSTIGSCFLLCSKIRTFICTQNSLGIKAFLQRTLTHAAWRQFIFMLASILH